MEFAHRPPKAIKRSVDAQVGSGETIKAFKRCPILFFNFFFFFQDEKAVIYYMRDTRDKKTCTSENDSKNIWSKRGLHESISN